MSRIAVVFVSYLKVPEERLQDHFRWNGHIYEQYGDQLRVYVVSDVDHRLPGYAETVIFPEELLPVVVGRRRFSLCKTKNAGIATAIAHGAGVIVCTDVDIAFEWGTVTCGLTPAIGGVSVDETAAIPVYRMAPSYEERAAGRLDHGCTGTVSMTAAGWKAVQRDVGQLHPDAKGPFDERCVAYGADDGILLRAVERVGLEVIRDCEVAHIAHVQGDGARTPGSGSNTCWGREDGFNFDNFRQNRRLHDDRPRRRRRLHTTRRRQSP